MFSTKISLSDVELPNGDNCDITVSVQTSENIDYLMHDFGKTELRDPDLEDIEIEIIESRIFKADGAEDTERDFTIEELNLLNDRILAAARTAEWEHDEDEPREIDYND